MQSGLVITSLHCFYQANIKTQSPMNSRTTTPPALRVSTWLNCKTPINLESLHDKVVLLYAFQMLCPGCVSHSIPQAINVDKHFAKKDVAVIGLHTVFEHHAAMGEVALRAFIHEYRIPFPVGIDQPASSGPIPLTMQAYQLQGTPSLLLFDRKGELRLQHFGRVDDLQLGAMIGQLIAEPVSKVVALNSESIPVKGCDDDACSVNI
jgi:thiol-disulfide isomerase/thioredoxin